MTSNLHAHSYYSDGSESPEKIVELASKAGVKLLSLTDHNTYDGYCRFEKACDEHNIAFVKGVEIDCSQPEIDYFSELLVYFPNGGSEKMEEILESKLRERYSKLNNAIKVTRELYDIRNITLEGLSKFVYNERGFHTMPSNKQLYKYLVEMGLEIPEYGIFKSSPSWKPMCKSESTNDKYSLYDVIDIATRAGGRTVLPHFGIHCKLNPNNMMERYDDYISQLKSMKQHGLWGMELHPYKHIPEADKINDIIERMASELDLHLTTGTDFHGYGSPHKMSHEFNTNFTGF